MSAYSVNALLQRERALPRHLSSSAATFCKDVSGRWGFIRRMEMQRCLESHDGCVNGVSFDSSGDVLVSGSDDLTVILWDWRLGVPRMRFQPGHTNNIFQAQFLPGSYNKTLVSCAADGQVRVSYFQEGTSHPATRRLHLHKGRAHRLALQHGSPYDPGCGNAGGGGPPCFYSSGMDGDVCFFDLRVSDSAPLGRMAAMTTGWAAGGGWCGVRSRSSDGSVVRRRTRQIIDLNGVHVNPARPWQLVVGGADEAVVVYDNRILTSLTTSYGGGCSGSIGGADDTSVGCRQVEGRPLFELCPSNLRRTADLSVRHRPTHVTCVIFSQNGDVLATYNDDDVYLFRPPGTQGSGGGQGKPGGRGDSDDDDEAYHRRCRADAGRPSGGGCTSASHGSRLKAGDDHDDDDEFDSFLRPSWRRRRGSAATAAVMAAAEAAPTATRCGSVAESEDYVIGRYSGHWNNRTVKGVNFLGERQEWVVSGSDCGHIYIWSRATCELHCCLRGDAYIVNCLEPHPSLPLHLATSGLDDDIKVWAPMAEEPRPLGPSAEAAIAANARQRAAERSRVLRSGTRRVVVPRAMLQMLLGGLSREGDEGGGDQPIQDLLMAALRGGVDSEDEYDNEDDEDDDDDDDSRRLEESEDETSDEETEEGSRERLTRDSEGDSEGSSGSGGEGKEAGGRDRSRSRSTERLGGPTGSSGFGSGDGGGGGMARGGICTGRGGRGP